MKPNFTLSFTRLFIILAFSCFATSQLAAQNTDTTHLYGLTKSGYIYLINTTNANCGDSAINPKYDPADSAMEANAMGYDTATKSFYFFKRNFNDAPVEFVSFNTVTKQYTTLAAAPITGNTYRGCINPDGTGYYCLDVNSNFYYYDITANAWTTVTANFVDQNNNNVTSVFLAYPSGDMAFDTNGNLWILCSTASHYGLYKAAAPLPTTAVDTIVVNQILSDTTQTPSGLYPFGGIAFDATGQIFLSSGSPGNQLYLMHDDLTLQSIGTLTADGAGSDLTSDIFPQTQLPVTYLNFDGVLHDNIAVLNWSTASEINNKGFEVERSTDAQTFTAIGFVTGHGTSSLVNNYNFSDPKLLSGNNYYRLKQIDLDGKYSYSSVIKLSFNKFEWSVLGNPSGNMWVQLQLDKTYNISLQIVSLAGNIVQTINKGNLSAGTYSFPLNLNVASGMYIARLLVDGKSYVKNIMK